MSAELLMINKHSFGRLTTDQRTSELVFLPDMTYGHYEQVNTEKCMGKPGKEKVLFELRYFCEQ
jgi:hypothetical protein